MLARRAESGSTPHLLLALREKRIRHAALFARATAPQGFGVGLRHARDISRGALGGARSGSVPEGDL